MKFLKKSGILFLAAIITVALVSCSSGKNSMPEDSGPEADKHTEEEVTHHVSGENDTSFPSDSVTGSDDQPDESEAITVSPEAMAEKYELDGEIIIMNAVNCPVVSGGNSYNTVKINETLRSFCQKFVSVDSSGKAEAKEDYEASKADGIDFVPYEKSADYNYYIKDGTLSLCFNIYAQSGGADEMRTIAAFCFDLTSGERIDFADYIGKSREFAAEYIEGAFRVLIISSPENYYDDALDILKSAVSPDNFYLTDEGVVIFVNTSSIAPSAFGIQTLTVPYTNLPK